MRKRDRQAIARAFFEGAPPMSVYDIVFAERWCLCLRDEAIRLEDAMGDVVRQEAIVEDCIREFAEPASRAWGRK